MKTGYIQPNITYLNGLIGYIRDGAPYAKNCQLIAHEARELLSGLTRIDQFSRMNRSAETNHELQRILAHPQRAGYAVIALDMYFRSLLVEVDDTHDWQSVVGQSLFEIMRWTPYYRESPEISTLCGAQSIPITVNFDAYKGKIVSVVRHHILKEMSSYRGIPLGFRYEPDTDCLDFDETAFHKLAGPPQYPRKALDLISALDDQPLSFPQIKIPTNLEHTLFDSNIYYCENVLNRIDQLHARSISEDVANDLEGINAKPEISVSIAANGMFVGLTSQMPSSLVELVAGIPHLGTIVRLTYQTYVRDGDTTMGVIRMPSSFAWQGSPNRFQLMATQRWREATIQRMCQEDGWAQVGN